MIFRENAAFFQKTPKNTQKHPKTPENTQKTPEFANNIKFYVLWTRTALELKDPVHSVVMKKLFVTNNFF